MFKPINVAVKVGTFAMERITDFMRRDDCSLEERNACQQLLETGDVGVANSAGLSIKILDGRAYVARTDTLPLVHGGRLIMQ